MTTSPYSTAGNNLTITPQIIPQNSTSIANELSFTSSNRVSTLASQLSKTKLPPPPPNPTNPQHLSIRSRDLLDGPHTTNITENTSSTLQSHLSSSISAGESTDHHSATSFSFSRLEGSILART